MAFLLAMKDFVKNSPCLFGRREERVVDPECLFVTNGATHGILLSIVALSAGRASVIVERPTYFPLLDLFRELNLDLYFADVDDEGISSSDIKRHLKKIKGTVFIHCTPYFQNPTGVCMSERRAVELYNIMKKNKNIWLLSDNVYKYLSFTSRVSPNILDSSVTKKIINIGSFSKILSPGLRVGWIEAEKSVIHSIAESGYVQSSGGFNPIVCRLIENIIGTKEIDKIIETWIKFLKKKQYELVEVVKDLFPESLFSVPDGGYYIWVNFKNKLIANASFREYMKKEKGIVYVPGIKCAGGSKLFKDFMRLGYATYKDDSLIRGLKIFKKGLGTFKD